MEWAKAPLGELRKIRGVCLDIDETLSTKGKLTAGAFSALWALKEAGFVVVPITGRPAGWCDQIARFWPVDAVVGENGAFVFFMEGGVRRRLESPGAPPRDERKRKLATLGEKIRARFPHAKWASDQDYREFDLAIDVCEDVPEWPKEDIDELLALCSREGAHAKLSSVHVNAWFGDYDKRRGIESWIRNGAPGLKKRAPKWEELLFIGDSPNDEPMFESFRSSVGVANIKRYLSRLKHPPRWVTARSSGAGFEEMVKRLLRARRSAR